MSQGLQIFDADGNITLDITDRFTRCLGIITSGTTSSSVIDADLANGVPWYIVRIVPMDNIGFIQPLLVTISGTTLSWTFSGAGDAYSHYIYYGVY